MSRPHAHDDLAPLLFDFVPTGRGHNDVLLYKMMRWWYRKNRQQLYDATMDLWRDVMLHGTAFFKVKWDADFDG